MLIEIKDDHSNIGKAMDILQSNDIEYRGVNIEEMNATINAPYINPDINYSFYSFGGADIIICINDNVVGETQKISYDTITKEMTIECIDFICITHEQENMAEKCRCHSLMTSLKDAKIKIIAANEYGHKRYREIRGVNYIGEKGSNAIDDLITSTKYVFSFTEITEPLNINKHVSTQDLIDNSDILFTKE